MEKRMQYEHLVLDGLNCKMLDAMFAHANFYDFSQNHLKECYCFVLAALVGLKNKEGYSQYEQGLSVLIDEVSGTISDDKESVAGLDTIFDRVQQIGIII